MWRAALFASLILGSGSCSSLGPPGGDYGQRPDWSLVLPGGHSVSAADFDRRVLLVDFWASWCPPCRGEIPGFIELQNKYRDMGLAIVGFSFDRSADTHDAWIREHGVNYLSIYSQTDEGREVVARWEKLIDPIRVLPTTLIIDRAGRIVHKHVGYGSVEDFERLILPILRS